MKEHLFLFGLKDPKALDKASLFVRSSSTSSCLPRVSWRKFAPPSLSPDEENKEVKPTSDF